MLGFCVGVLLIACANVMNMQFARATLRARELAIRSSLGANRLRLVRQMLTESLLLSSIGAALGIVLAYLATDWLQATVRNLDNPPPSWITFDLAPAVLAVTVIATIGAAVVSGLLPALGSSRHSHVDVLRDSGRGNTSYRVSLLSRGLVVFQIVVTCVPSAETLPRPTISKIPVFGLIDQMSTSEPASRLSVFGKVIGAGGLNVISPGWMAITRLGSRVDGSAAGVRMRSTRGMNMSPWKRFPSRSRAAPAATSRQTPNAEFSMWDAAAGSIEPADPPSQGR